MPWDQPPGSFYGPPDLVSLVRHRARHQPDAVAFTYLVDGETEELVLTNAGLDRQARAIGAWLESRGMAGERALLMYPPGLDFIAAFFGCLYAGVVACPIYPPRRNRSLARVQAIADDAGAKVALTSDAVLTRIQGVLAETPDLEKLAWLETTHLPEGIEERWTDPKIDSQTLAFLQYTSGSTGTPKGVMLTHGNLVHNSAIIAHAFEHTRTSSGVFWLPCYHDMGLIGGIVQPLYAGRPNVLMSPMAFLQKPLRWLSAISRYRGTTSGGPNFAYDLCVRAIGPREREQLDLSSWRIAFNGAEPVRDETIDRFTEAFAPCGFRREAFFPCYGLAEATLLVGGGGAHDEPVIRLFDGDEIAEGRAVEACGGAERARPLVGCGQTMPDQQIVVADPESCATCPAGTIGEIWVGGPSVAQGYWNQPEASAATFGARLSDTGAGPFLRTGDLGFLQNGELFVTGRIKDLIILHGVNIYPQDIERTVQSCHADLRPDSGAAFAVDGGGRERLVVVHEVERRAKGELDAVIDAIRRAVSVEHELSPEAIVLVKAGSVPKTSSGKIQRHACRAAYLEGTLDKVAEWRPDEDTVPATSRLAERRRQRRELRRAASRHGADAPATRKTPAARRAARRRFDAPHPAHDVETTAPISGDTSEIVLEHVRRVARDRASGLTLDTAITEIGLDSIERMEILASLEETFGGRFPPDVLIELETCRQVVDAVEKHLGREPRAARAAAGAEVPLEHYRLECFPEYVALRQNLDRLETSGLGNPFFTVHESVTTDRTRIGGRELVNFSSYNYVGMSGDPSVIRAAQDAAARYGTSVSASRLVSGQKPLHVNLERGIARFVGTDDAIVLVGGHSTNESIIGHLFGPGDLILHDALSHNSILQGCILSGARRRPFPHNDWREADRLLAQYRHEYRRVLVVIEGVYSMDGDIPDLPQFIEVKKRHKALLMIDEAHSMGTLGSTGRGIGEHFGVERGDVDLWMGTLSKSFGSCGGYIAGSKAAVEYLRYTAPGFVYSVGISPPNAAAALASLTLLESQPERVARLQDRSRLFLELARSQGLNTGMSKDSPVVPVILGNSLDCLALSKSLFARGINVQPILYPAVEERAARLRFFLTSLHSEAQIRMTVSAVVEELAQINPAYLQPTLPMSANVAEQAAEWALDCQ